MADLLFRLALNDNKRRKRQLGALLALSRVIDAINTLIGRWVSWLIFVAVIVSSGNALVRYTFNTSSNKWLELQWYLFGTVFLLCSAWTLLANEHIRIDVVASRFSQRTRDWIDLIGHAFFLLPLCVLMIVDSWPFFLRSFLQSEQSMNAGGLIVWPAKIMVLLGFVLLFFQGISELIKRIAIMRGLIADPHAHGGHLSAAEAEAQRLLEIAKAEGLVTTPLSGPQK